MIPADVHTQLKTASRKIRASKAFFCEICGDDWDRFIETWAPVCYAFVQEALGGYATDPHSVILPLSDPSHSAGANASFELGSGQVRLSPSVVRGKPGITLEKLTHEFTHGALAAFPEGDPFYEEGYVDYSVWVMAHAPIWGIYRQSMIDAAAFNIKCRRDRALRDLSDYDRKRWAGGLFCSTMHGPWIVSKLKMRKAEGNLQW
jgi:hypothetical protein